MPTIVWGQTSADSLKNYPLATKSDLDTLVEYQANRIDTDVPGRRTVLLGNAQVVYRGMRLSAGKIVIDWDKNLLIAEGVPDTSAADSSGANNGETGSKLTALPVFEEGGEAMTGEKMFYNFKTRKGRVIKGRTTYQEGYYAGEQLKRVSEKVFYVKRGRFTTCDLPDPHYYFLSDRMKMIYQDKVIARPIVMYIHHIPVAALPYGMFPYRKGRHSGILVPRYGQSATE
ncbi:MAG TPA: LPS-assembly protein LptD, partial [Bacteroidetes bacterium]|nr:LPS-assembly protein LptD [Bacteroidota bacterium]